MEVEFLKSLFASMRPPDAAVAPELFSGNPDSPLWFISVNPSGRGGRPTWGNLRTNPEGYLSFYRNRFRMVDFSKRPSENATGKSLSRVLLNELDCVYEFCEGAQIPADKRWEYVMKTNKFGTHAGNLKTLFGGSHHILALDEPLRLMVRRYRPLVITLLSKRASGVLGDEQQIRMINDEPDLTADGLLPLVLLANTSAYIPLNSRQREYFRKLGRQFAARKARRS